MAEPENDKQLDDLLESLLSEYSAAQPRPGYETRTLAVMKDAARQKKSWPWSLDGLWAGAVGAVVAAVVVFTLFSRPAQWPAPQVVREIAPAPRRTAAPPVAALQPAAPRHVIRNAGSRETVAESRLDVFPTRSPLSEQERLLLRYLAGTPREELIAQSRPDPVPAGMEDEDVLPRDLTQVPQRWSNIR